MLGPANSLQTMVDLPVADQLALRTRAVVSWRVAMAVLLLSLLVMLVFVPGSASAEPLCTDTWTGPAEGPWRTAEDWSTGKVPVSTDVACIGAGKTVKVTEGTNQTGVLEGEGGVELSGGSLEVANALESSSIKSLSVFRATLTGAGTVRVTGSFTFSANGTMSGTGKTIIGPAVVGTMESSEAEPIQISERSLINEGTLTFGGFGPIAMAEGARLENKGTFKINAHNPFEGSAIYIKAGSKTAPALINAGTLKKTEAGPTTIAVPVENHGVVTSQKPAVRLGLSDGGSSNAAGEWMGTEGSSVALTGGTFMMAGGAWVGPVLIAGASVTAESVAGKTAEVTVSAGSLTIPGGTITVAGFTLFQATLTGAGNLDVNGSFLFGSNGVMSGTGKTIIASAAVGRMEGSETEPMQISERSLINEGIMTFDSFGPIAMAEGARLENTGTFKANAHNPFEGSAIYINAGSKTAPTVVNSGTFEKTEGTWTTTVQVAFENYGTVGALEHDGNIAIVKPITPEPSTQYGCDENPSTPDRELPTEGEDVCTATGDFSQSQTDFSVGGRGVGLDLTRTYTTRRRPRLATHGAFGYGWSQLVQRSSRGRTKANKVTTLVRPTAARSRSPKAAAEPLRRLCGRRTHRPVARKRAGYTLTLANQTVYKFAGASGGWKA